MSRWPPGWQRRARPGAEAALVAAVALVTLAAAGCGVGTVGSAEPGAAELPPLGLQAIQQLEFPPLEFDPPTPDSFELSNGVTVFFLHDDGLPLVDVSVSLRGGYAYFDREQYAAASGLLPLMRNAGTQRFTPDSLDAHIAFHALGIRTSTNGTRMILGVTGLRRQLDLVLETWSQILLRPRFQTDAVDRWRARELEAVRRRSDFPGSLAVLEFNRLMFGDHPTGWVMTPAELAAERVAGARLRELHRRVVCPENAVIGASGDVDREVLRAALETALVGWNPCGGSLEPPPPPSLTPSPRVYVIPNSRPQSTVVVGHPGGILMEESRGYFASRVANWVIGGSGFTSRLMTRLRTQEGLAYSAASVWGAARTHERIFGAITHTRSESTVEATQVVIATLAEARRDPPGQEEIALAQNAIINGFVFGFGSSVEIVSRQVSYLADGLPADWLSRYFTGIRAVEPGDVARVIRSHVDPADLTILIVGDTTAFDPSRLGPVTVLDDGEG